MGQQFPTKKQFIEWIQGQEDSDKINYYSPKRCVFARFFTSIGVEFFNIGGNEYYDSEPEYHAFPQWAREVSLKAAGSLTIKDLKESMDI